MRVVPRLVLKASVPACAASESDVLDEQAVSAIDTVAVAINRRIV
ncbi:hypothetical protein [Mycobacterium simiae]